MKLKINRILITGSLMLCLFFIHQYEVKQFNKQYQDLNSKYQLLQDINKQLQQRIEAQEKIIFEKEQIIENYKKKLNTKTSAPISSRGRQNFIIHRYNIYSDITQPCGLNTEQLSYALEGTKLQKYAGHFINVEQKHGVNAVFMVAIAALESSWGTSNFANTHNNLFGFQAYDNNLNKTAKFSSKSQSIYFVGKYIAEHYLDEKGIYYNGTTIKDVNQKYSTSDEWKNKIVTIMNMITKRALEYQGEE